MLEILIGMVIGIALSFKVVSWLFSTVSDPVVQTHRTIMAKIEEIDGVFYMWDTKDNSFMFQGKTTEELVNKARSMFANTTITMIDDKSAIEKLGIQKETS